MKKEVGNFNNQEINVIGSFAPSNTDNNKGISNNYFKNNKNDTMGFHTIFSTYNTNTNPINNYNDGNKI